MQRSTTYQQKIIEKRAELEKLQEFRKLSATLADHLEEVEEKVDRMNDGAESIGAVLSNWQNVIRSVSLASIGLMKHSENDYRRGAPLPEPLVRIKLDQDEYIDESENTSQKEDKIAEESIQGENE